MLIREGPSFPTLAGASPSQTLGVTAVIPCYDEADGLARAYAELASELSSYDAELLFVDDGSRDRTLELIKGFAARDPRVRYISFTRNFGLEAAFGAGFRYASKPWIVQLDADLQSPPSEVHRLLARALEGDVDVVFGIRRDRRDSWFRCAASWLQHWLARRVLGLQIPPGASTFRVVRTSVAKKISGLRLGTPYFLAAVPMTGARHATVDTEHVPRRHGRSRFRLVKLASHAVDLFFGFSLRPFALLPAFAALAGLPAVVVPLVTSGGAATARAALAAVLAVQVLSLTALALLGRYVMGLVRQAHPLRYLVRESNLEIMPEDLLHEYENVPDLASPRGVA
ncbi:MAG: glycosyltransferase family 2 protein [Gaiellaceae bacterium]